MENAHLLAEFHKTDLDDLGVVIERGKLNKYGVS